MQHLFCILFFLFASASLAWGDTLAYDSLFTTQTLRFDFRHAGDAQSECYYFDGLKAEGTWAGPRHHLVQPFDCGEQQFRIVDEATGRVIFSQGYCTLFNEWQTTPEAREVPRSMPEAVIFPFPKKPFWIEIYSRHNAQRVLTKMFSMRIDPSDPRISPYSPTAPVFSIADCGKPLDKSVDIVLLPDGFTGEEQASFLSACEAFRDALFSYAPFDRNQHRINIRAVWQPSPQSGVCSPLSGQWVQNTFGSTFDTFNSTRYQTTEHFDRVRDVASNAPYEAIFILTNTDRYGGSGIFNFYGLGAAHHIKRSAAVYVHEFGHSFAGLGDEYVEAENTVSDFYPPGVEPWEKNLTSLVDFDRKWKSMVDASTPVPTPVDSSLVAAKDYARWPVGVYEGGGYLEKGVYRPWPQCLMNKLDYPFCPVCQKVIEDYIDYLCQ